MSEYKQRTPKIEAVQFTGYNFNEIVDFTKCAITFDPTLFSGIQFAISCSNGNFIVGHKTDYIVKDDIKGFKIINENDFIKQWEPIK